MNRLHRRKTLARLLAAALWIPASTWAQTPAATKTLTLLVPYGPGGATDIVARVLADALRKQTGQVVVVENRPGANGAIALEALGRAPKDGSTALIGNPATNALLPLVLARKGRAEPSIPTARVATVAGVLVAAKDFPARNVAELIEQVKKQPGKVSYASAGVGSMAHLSFLALAEQGKLDMIHVPYKGGAQALTDNLAGLVQLNFLNLATATPLIKDGKLKALGVSGTARAEQLPEVPTLQEQGYDGAITPNWQGVFLPAGTPQTLVDAMAAQVGRAVQSAEMRAALVASNIAPSASSSPKEFAVFVDKASEHFKALIAKHSIEVE